MAASFRALLCNSLSFQQNYLAAEHFDNLGYFCFQISLTQVAFLPTDEAASTKQELLVASKTSFLKKKRKKKRKILRYYNEAWSGHLNLNSY